jgi:Domain of unknown function (DUF397)
MIPEGTWFKSSYSQENGNACVEVAWFKSSYSQENGNNCVEVANLPTTNHVGIRDSKDKTGPTLTVPAASWAAFIAELRNGTFDHGMLD